MIRGAGGPWSGAEAKLVALVQQVQTALRRERVFEQVRADAALSVALDSMIERGVMKVATRNLPLPRTWRGGNAPQGFGAKPVTGIYFMPGKPRYETRGGGA